MKVYTSKSSQSLQKVNISKVFEITADYRDGNATYTCLRGGLNEEFHEGSKGF